MATPPPQPLPLTAPQGACIAGTPGACSRFYYCGGDNVCHLNAASIAIAAAAFIALVAIIAAAISCAMRGRGGGALQMQTLDADVDEEW